MMNTALQIVIIVATVILVTAFLVVAWEMEHDIQPRDPYQR